jgi:hypothetical protein
MLTRNLALAAAGALALATLAATLGLTELALAFDRGLLVVAAALDLAQHPFARHEPSELADRSLDTALVDADFQRPSKHRQVLLGGIGGRGGSWRVGG